MSIYPLLHNVAFEPAHVEQMAQAYEAVCITLNLTNDDPSRVEVAHKVISRGKRGVLTAEGLYHDVMSEMRIEPPDRIAG
jgi:hypothetical protein